MRVLSPSREVRPLWQQVGLLAAYALACLATAAFAILAFVAFSAAWGPVQ